MFVQFMFMYKESSSLYVYIMLSLEQWMYN